MKEVVPKGSDHKDYTLFIMSYKRYIVDMGMILSLWGSYFVVYPSC